MEALLHPPSALLPVERHPLVWQPLRGSLILDCEVIQKLALLNVALKL